MSTTFLRMLITVHHKLWTPYVDMKSNCVKQNLTKTHLRHSLDHKVPEHSYSSHSLHLNVEILPVILANENKIFFVGDYANTMTKQSENYHVDEKFPKYCRYFGDTVKIVDTRIGDHFLLKTSQKILGRYHSDKIINVRGADSALTGFRQTDESKNHSHHFHSRTPIINLNDQSKNGTKKKKKTATSRTLHHTISIVLLFRNTQ